MRFCILALIVACFGSTGSIGADRTEKDLPKKADGVRVPYQLTETKHVMVRVKINDKGPFHFIVDTGAPALFVGTETAKKLGVTPDKRGRATVERFELEGGVLLKDVQGFIDDPFQLIGMNKMNLPGVRLDGILGYTILARFKIEFDFTQSHLVWTKLDWEPPVPMGLMELGGKPPKEMAAMGGMVNLAAMLVGRRPDPEYVFRGFIGVELAEEADGIRLKKVIANSPAAEAGLKAGDRLIQFKGKEVKELEEVHKLAAEHAAGKELELQVLRDGEKKPITVKPIQGI